MDGKFYKLKSPSNIFLSGSSLYEHVPTTKMLFYYLPDVLQRSSKGWCGHKSNFASTTQLKTEIYKTDVTHKVQYHKV